MTHYFILLLRQVVLFVTKNYMLIPRLMFVVTYYSLILHLSQYAFPARRRGNATDWMLSMAVLTQANETWKYITILIEYGLKLYKKGEPYRTMLFNKIYLLPMLDTEALRICVSLVMACLPWVISYIVEKRHRRFRVTWLDIRRRYRNEIGSARYYLTRPLTPSEEPYVEKKLQKSRSAEVFSRNVKPLPKMPRTA